MKPFRRRDGKFAFVVGVTALLIIAFFLAGVEVARVVVGGARKVDTEKIESMVQEGELSAREAMYSRETQGGEPAPAPGGPPGE